VLWRAYQLSVHELAEWGPVRCTTKRRKIKDKDLHQYDHGNWYVGVSIKLSNLFDLGKPSHS